MIFILGVVFSLYFGTAIFLTAVGTSSDPLYTMVRYLMTFSNGLFCLVSSIMIIFLIFLCN
ncbi:MAG: hypothetical protein K0Q49_589 [Haloplasmataceae bacterium]|jgi:hypothetical protein|nr:hypothetical protein [Haloplasmataceae bacterium]